MGAYKVQTPYPLMGLEQSPEKENDFYYDNIFLL